MTLFYFSCLTNQTSKPKKLSGSYLSALITRLSGKCYPYKPGKYKGNKTFAFFIDKENWPFEDSIVSSTLRENHLMALDSTELKTVVLLYSNTLPLEILINQKNNEQNKNGFQICFIDLDSMCIRKIVSTNYASPYPESNNLIAKRIIEEF